MAEYRKFKGFFFANQTMANKQIISPAIRKYCTHINSIACIRS
jgi:hypothetical protein